DELEPHELSLAKKAVAFFNIARSISSTLMRWRSSLFSASRPAWLVAVGLDCFRAASTQFRTAESVSSNSRATCAMDLPLVSIRLTTSALNSGVYDRRFRFLVLLDTWTSSFPHLACPPNWGRFKVSQLLGRRY